MAIVISLCGQKGGIGKTTSSGLAGYMLSEMGYNVLMIDMDSQGNLTQLATGEDDLSDFVDNTILEAMKNEDIKPYIISLGDKLHIVPADDYLVTIADYLYTSYKGNHSLLLHKIIEPIKEDYDFIIIDTPPALSKQTINALSASDYVVIMFETSKFSYNAIPRFIETVEGVQDHTNPNLKIAGILTTLSDNRRIDNKLLSDIAREDYGDLMFNCIVNKRAAVGRLPVYGFNGNPEINRATEQYQPFLKELLERVYAR